MVKHKGAGYALEAIVAIATIFIFVFGSLNVPANQDWSEFREQTSADDLTYTLEQIGYINHTLKNRELGSLQTAFSTITERDVEVSGLVSNLPITENRVAFYVLNSDRYTQNLEPVEPGDTCYQNLEEINSTSEEPVLRSNGGQLQSSKSNRTYIGDLDPNIAGGNDKTDYDSLWVDNGTACQFDSDEGPYNIEEMFRWGDDYYDIKWINASSNEEIRLYQSTQPVRFRKILNEPINGVKTFSSVDTVNFTSLDKRNYNTVVFRESQSLDDIEIDENRQIVENFLKEGSILFLADLDQTYFSSGSLLEDAGYKNLSVSYEGSYTGNEVQGVFPGNDDAQETLTYFKGLGEPGPISIKPSTRVISNTRSGIEAGGTLVEASENYNFSEWDSKSTTMSPNSSAISGAPQSACYFNSTGGERDRSLTEDVFSFPENSYKIINAELGTSNNFCNNNNVRAIKIDLDDDNDFYESEEGPYLNGEIIKIDNRTYTVDIILEDPDPSKECNEEGGCVEFTYAGDKRVELISHRTSFTDLEGQRMALTGYEDQYSEPDLKLLASTIYWLRGDQTNFRGNQDPDGISTSTVSGIQNRTYMPYELNLRWSR